MSIVKPPNRKLKLWIIGSAIFLCLYALVGFFLVPWLITSQTPTQIKENLGREASLKEATFNPFTLELDIKDFEMLEHNGQPFASFERLYVNYGLWSSISHLSVALQDVLLEKPYGHVDILKDGSFNFSDLSKNTEEEPETEEEEDDGLFPVWIGDLAINDGSVKFEDHSLKTAFTEEVKQLNLHIKGLTTKKDGVTPYDIVLALASGANLKLSGDTVLDPLTAKGTLKLSKLSMHKVWEYLRDTADFEMQQGDLDLSAKYAFDGSGKEKTAVNISDGLITLNNFKFITLSGDATQLGLPQLELKDIAVNVQSAAQQQSIGIKIPAVNANNTTVNIQGSDALAIAIPTLALTDTGIDINTDETQKTAIKIINKQLAITKFGLETSGVRELFVTVSDIAFDNFDMDIVSSDNSEQSVMRLNNQNLSIKNTNIGSTSDKVALIEVPTLSVDNLGVDLDKQTVTIAKVGSSKATISSRLAKDGVLNLQALFAGTPQETAPVETPVESEEKPADAEWTVQLNTLALSDYQFDFEDDNTQPVAKIMLSPINLTINEFSTDFSKPFQLAFDTDINQKGKFSTKGSVAIDPLSTQLDIAASKIALNVLQPYINQFAKLKMKKGRFYVKGKLDLATNKSDKPIGSFKGNASISGLRTVNTINKKDFLKWKAFNVNGINFDLEPMQLAIREVSTDGLYSRVVINKDKTTNLGEIFPSDEQSKANKNKSDKKKSAEKTSEKKKQDSMPLKIGVVKINNGAALFSDLSLVMPFALNMTDLNGAIKDISSSKTQTASVNIDGKVNRIAPVKIDGSLKPFDIEDFLDIKLNVQDVDLTAVTPYMAQFAGYAIDKGKIRLDLNYKIKEKKLVAENKVVIDQLTLGEEIDSPDAVSLPVKLAIGLLQDQNGVIDLDLPMEGSLDEPEFSIAGLIGKVLVNLLTKAATSPFSLLGGLGGAGDDASGVVFSRGLSKLDDTELEKLKKISEALKSRPKLKVEVKGIALRKTDRLGLAENKLLTRMKNEKWDDIEGDDGAPEKPNLVELTREEENAMIVEYYQDDVEDAKSPETTESADGEEIIPENYYQLAKKGLVDQVKITDLDLQQLAQKRANSIAHQLIKVGGLPADRIFVVKESVEEDSEPEIAETVTVELTLTTP